ncbi:GAF and ANTAR domain-containing protein [Rathayibacter sp. SD072]|uniref:GAF and ANTAR domain-containing protein n=1 Tax=Rathayibacter sp. SD072 TaxID=2781731 RepID=UPI001A96A56E|nr:GAF and ANTAR domain-containing protein [Rathayibacter sp. SD072]MBO0985228.1 GAF and ANTAR domain-containing protein [Rathayibacter sp. SD072]
MTSSDREARLADVFVALADALRPEHDVIDTLDTLVQAATRFTAAADAGIVLADADGVLHVMASTSERAAELEEEQLGTTEGPCLEAFHGGAVVESADLAATDRWPDFSRTALERGFRAVHATPLRHRDRTLGAINLFTREPGPFSDNDIAVVQALADVATLGLVFSETLREQNDIAAQLQRALDSRVVIEQAKGVLAERQNISVDKAFTLLRAHARRTGAKLRDVAHGVVSTTTTL